MLFVACCSSDEEDNGEDIEPLVQEMKEDETFIELSNEMDEHHPGPTTSVEIVQLTGLAAYESSSEESD